MRAVVVLVLMLCSGCPASKKASETVPKSGANAYSKADKEELLRDLQATVLENYSHLSLGNFEAFKDNIAEDRTVVLFGVRPSDLVVGMNAASLERDRRLYRDRGITLYSKNLEATLSDDASLGWISDEVSYRFPYQGREVVIPLRYSSAYIRGVDRWVLVTEHVSYGLPEAAISQLSQQQRLPRMRRLGKIIEDSDAARAAAALVERVHLLNKSARQPLFSAAESALLVLPDPLQEYQGSQIEEAPLVRDLFGGNGQIRTVGVVAGATGTQRVAWVSAHHILTAQRNGVSVEIPLRGTYIVEQSAEKDWQIVDAHISVPLSLAVINTRVFSQISLDDKE